MLQYYNILWLTLDIFPPQGDGLDFKRHFLKIKAQLKDIIDR